MFIYNQNQIDDNQKKKVINYYESGLDIRKISKKTKLLTNDILYILCEKKKRIVDPTCIDINDQKIIIISDTHIGSILDNILYLDYVYNYAIINNINTILHGGDLIQSAINHTRKKLSTARLQIEYLIKNYPNASTITNYILLGNHDFHGLKNKEDNWQLLNSRKDINILGFNKALINWQNNNIALSHKIKDYNLNLPNFPSKLYFVGHRHSIRINNRPSIFIPTLSDDLKYYENELNYPGFLVAELTNNQLIINHIIIQNGLKDNGPVLRKNML